MYNSYEEKKAKVGRVSVSVRDNSIKLRFTYPKGKMHDINVAVFSEPGWRKALGVAEAINFDIELDQFDTTLARYSPRRSQALEIANRPPNLLDLWETYKELSKNRVAKTTIKRSWIPWENLYLGGKTPPELLEIDRASDFVMHLLSRYSPGSLDSFFSNCLMPSVNLAVKTGRIKRNPYAAIPITKKHKKEIEAYEPKEVKAIINAFYFSDYISKYSPYNYDYYAPLVEFLALTGCRPSEAHALTWDDIQRKPDRTHISFRKAYSVGILLPTTKTHEIRLFPVNEQLSKLLGEIKKGENYYTHDNPHNLIFPAVKGGYINQRSFTRRAWKRIIQGLIDDGMLEKHYRCYSLRHSFITRCVRDGMDIATIARISGNSTETIVNFYLSARKDGFTIPEL